MQYKITSTSYYRDERLLEEYPCLKDFGWKFVEVTQDRRVRIFDETGSGMYQVLSETWYKPCIEINTLEDLQKLQAAVESPLIITEDEIEIYDDYRE